MVGNACLDVVYHLGSLPKPGETLIAQKVETDLGGKGLNQAIAAGRAGADVQLIAAIGRDETAERIKAALASEGIAGNGLIAHEGASDSSLLLIEPEGENVIISNTSQALSLMPAEITLSSADLLLLQGNLSEETTRHAMDMARQAGMRVALNPSPSQGWFRDLPQVDLIIANQVEADALEENAARLKVVTLGEKGCLVRQEGADIHISAPQVRAVSAAGAGDVFAGTFIAEWLATGDAGKAARLAVLAASDKTTRHGTLSAFPDRPTIAGFRHHLASS